jgi:serine/threonine protein kinase
LTQTDAVGTPAYAAPEQARGAKDGCTRGRLLARRVLFECLTGQPPFMGDNIMAILAKIFEEPPCV